MSKKAEKRAIVRLLLSAFHDDTILERWLLNVSDPYDKWIRHWLNDSGLSERIRSWFADNSIDDDNFTSEEISLMKRAAESTSALFEPMAKFLSRQWVGPEENDWAPDFCAVMLYVYSNLVGSLDDCGSVFSLISFENPNFKMSNACSEARLMDSIDLSTTVEWNKRKS